MITIEVKGLDELVRKFGDLPNDLMKEISDAMRKSAFLVEAKAKPLTPVDTGRLRASIRPDYIRPLEAAIAPHTEYAIYVHEGTRYMKARPFMKWGVKAAEGDIKKVFEEAISKVLNKF